MPTGYTADVQDGKITELRPFVLRCARAFGALVEMRDASMDAPLPMKIEPTRYHAERMAEATEHLRELHAMSSDEVAKAAEADFTERLSAWEKRRSVAALQRDRYDAMLDKVRVWSPPEACAGLKDFMVQQLITSISHDCSSSDKYDPKPVKMGPTAWLQSALESAKHDIEYHTKEWQQDLARAGEANLWLDALRVSLV